MPVAASSTVREAPPAQRGIWISPGAVIWRDGEILPVTLSRTEYRLLKYLASRPGDVCEYDAVMQAVWGDIRNKDSLHELVFRLRRKIERGERLMGFGHRVYRVRDPRADALKNALRKLAERGAVDRSRVILAEAVERAALSVLKRRKPDRPDPGLPFRAAAAAAGLPGRAPGVGHPHLRQRHAGRSLVKPARRFRRQLSGKISIAPAVCRLRRIFYF